MTPDFIRSAQDIAIFDAAEPASRDDAFALEGALYDEAALLDSQQFEAWLDLLDEGAFYRMPVVSNRLYRERDRTIGAVDDVAHFDEDRASFAMRVRRLAMATAWAEDPPSRIRRIVSNVRVRIASDAHYHVRSAVIVHRTRVDDENAIVTCMRYDTWRRSGPAQFRLRGRLLLLDDSVLDIGNLSFWF